MIVFFFSQAFIRAVSHSFSSHSFSLFLQCESLPVIFPPFLGQTTPLLVLSLNPWHFSSQITSLGVNIPLSTALELAHIYTRPVRRWHSRLAVAMERPRRPQAWRCFWREKNEGKKGKDCRFFSLTPINWLEQQVLLDTYWLDMWASGEIRFVLDDMSAGVAGTKLRLTAPSIPVQAARAVLLPLQVRSLYNACPAELIHPKCVIL